MIENRIERKLMDFHLAPLLLHTQWR